MRVLWVPCPPCLLFSSCCSSWLFKRTNGSLCWCVFLVVVVSSLKQACHYDFLWHRLLLSVSRSWLDFENGWRERKGQENDCSLRFPYLCWRCRCRSFHPRFFTRSFFFQSNWRNLSFPSWLSFSLQKETLCWVYVILSVSSSFFFNNIKPRNSLLPLLVVAVVVVSLSCPTTIVCKVWGEILLSFIVHHYRQTDGQK